MFNIYPSLLVLKDDPIENTWINAAVSDGVSTAAEVRSAIKARL